MANNDFPLQISNKRIITLILLLVSLTSFFAYKEMFSYFFAGGDVVGLIRYSKIQSFNDLLNIFNTQLSPKLFFYRPILKLSYGIDYYFWGLNTFGYHLTDFVLHVSVSILVFFIVYMLTEKEYITAGISSLLFTAHPIQMHIVPGTIFRSALLPAFFEMSSFLLFILYVQSAYKTKKLFFFSVILYILALGSHEVAIAFLPLFIFYQVIFSDSKKTSFHMKTLIATMRSIPFIIVAGVYFTWRSYILHGLGGYKMSFGKTLSGIDKIKSGIIIISNYFIDLFYPVNFMGLQRIQLVYLSIILIGFSIVIAILIFRSLKSVTNKRVMLLFVLWILLPLSLYVITISDVAFLSHHYMYMPMIPFSALLSVLCVSTYRLVIEKAKENNTAELFLIKKKSISIIILIMTISLYASYIFYSPVIRSYDNWKYSQMISRQFLSRFTEILNEAESGSVINVYDLPARVFHKGILHEGLESFCIDARTLESWKELTYPDKDITIVTHSAVWMTINPGEKEPGLNIDVDKKNKTVNIYIKRT